MTPVPPTSPARSTRRRRSHRPTAASARRRRLAALLVALLGALLGAQAAHPAASAAATGPTAVDDHLTLSTGYSGTLAGAKNDRAGSAAIQPGLTVFPTDGQPGGSAVSDGGRTIQVANHGTFVVNVRDGSVTFTAWTGKTGNVSVRYRIVDASGATADGVLSVVVTAGGDIDIVEAASGQEVAVVDLLANDTPGRNADGSPGTLDRSSVRFAGTQRDGITVSADGRTATVLDFYGEPVGVATLDDHGLLTFRGTNSSTEYGSSADLYYTARDTTRAADGTAEHHTYSGRISVASYPAPAPGSDPGPVVTTDDHVSTPYGASITLPGSTDDRLTDPSTTFKPSINRFDVNQVGPDDYVSADSRKVRYPGRGIFEVNADGTVLYVPPRGYAGRDAVNMIVFDNRLERGEEELVVDVQPGPTGTPDTARTAQNVTTSLPVLTNDTPGRNADGTPGSMDRGYVRFPADGQPAGATVSAYARTLTLPGVGVYRADRTTGAVSFDPDAGFVGTTPPVTYTAQDTVTRTDGRVVHNPVTATVTVTVTAVTPVALSNWASTPIGTSVEVPVLANDRAGAASAPLVASSIRLRTTPDLPSGSRLLDDAKVLEVAGDGTFTARADGVVVFAPTARFVGTVPTVGYQVSDANGSTARSTITVQVRSTP